MISSTRSSWTACIAAVYGSGCAIWPCASMPAPRSAASAGAAGARHRGAPASWRSLCGAMIRKPPGDRAARSLIFVEQRLVARPSRSRSRARSPRRPPRFRSTTTCSTGTAPATFSIRSTTCAHPARPRLRVRRDDDLVHRRLELRERVAHRVHRVGLDDEAVRRDPRRPKLLERLVEPPPGGRPPRVLVDDVALAGRVHRADDRDLSRRRPALERLASARARRPSRSRPPGRGSMLAPPRAHPTRSPLKTACRAPGTPYSYGVPTTCGSSSKLK